jgi:hypothetical protein
MTYEIPEDCPEEIEAEIEETHSDLATEHGRANVFVTVIDGEVVQNVGENVGLIDSPQVNTSSDSNLSV